MVQGRRYTQKECFELKTVVSASVQGYAFIFSRLDTVFSLVLAWLSILLSMHGFASYLVDCVDLQADEAEVEAAAQRSAVSL